MDESYSYAPLLHGGQIRLFKLHISREDEPLMGSMVAVSPDQIPPYKALSYTWGTPYGPEEFARLGLSSQTHQMYSIICDWRVLPVTENLYDALFELRSQEETAFLWIDAICINQKDEDEKSLQVQMMGSIYSNAEMVIVWLGKGTPECDEAIKLLMAYSKTDTTEGKGRELIDPYTEEQWGLIKTFCSRKWFARTWTLQEAILAHRIIGLCGSTEFDFYQIILLPCVISNRCVDPELLLWPHSEGYESGFECIEMIRQWTHIWNTRWIGLFEERIKRKGGPLSRRLSLSIHGVSQLGHFFALLDLLVSDMRHREVSDPKDRILAPMAVFLNSVYMFNSQAGEIIKEFTNYRHDVGSLYQRYTMASIIVADNLDVLSQVGGSHCMPPLDLPSWVPDFRSKPLPSLLEGTSFNASNGLGEFDARSCTMGGRSTDSQTDHDKIYVKLKLRGVLLGQILHIQKSRELPTSMWLLFRKFVMSKSQYQSQDYPEIISRTLTADTYWGKCPASDDVQVLFVAFIMVEMALELKRYLSHAQDTSLAVFWETQIEFLEFWKNDVQSQKLTKIVGREAPTAIRENIEETLYKVEEEIASRVPGLPPSRTRSVLATGQSMIDAYSATEKFLFATDSGYLGLAPKDSEVGDAVWIVQGGKVPFILRSTGKGSFRFVGEAYVHGRMFGEMAEVAKAQNVPMQDILIDE